jgi:hypothetical protein
VEAKITITAHQEGAGLLVSLETDGDFSSETINRRFYSIPQLPPDDTEAAEFWSPILASIAGFLAPDDDEADYQDSDFAADPPTL